MQEQPRIKHLLSIRTLGPGRQLARMQIIMIIVEALRMIPHYIRRTHPEPLPNGGFRKVVTDFRELSTRTKTSFDEAARWLRWDVMDGLTAESSSAGKGEPWMNEFRMLTQYGATHVVVRDMYEGLGMFLAQCLEKTGGPLTWVSKAVSILIGGAGTRDHPSQVLLDAVTMIVRKFGFREMTEETARGIEALFEHGDDAVAERIAVILDNLKIAFVGDLLHSRVVHDWIHLGHWFDISFRLVAPKALQLEKWCWTPTCSSTDSLSKVGDPDYVYTIRLQRERLEASMTTHQASELVRSFEITLAFLRKTKADIMDAQPIDGRSPMIAANLWAHPRVIMLMQSAIAVPTRMAILRICDAGREQSFPLLTVPRYHLTNAAVTVQRSLDEQQARLTEKYAGQDLYLQWVIDGMVVDHIDPGLLQHIDAMNRAAGVYDHKGCGPLFLGRKMRSPSMGEKEALFAHNVCASLQLAACYGLVSPRVTVNMMSKASERHGRLGYRHLDLPLPKAVSGMWRCPNDNCVTNLRPEEPGDWKDSEIETFFWVHGKKGEKPGLECAFCEQHYSALSIIAPGLAA